uniref:Large proline-rich protein BAT3 n=1 Tax=Cajanus cajan TaxID=3821 RepID=A0A151SRE2_CAJCA|nr:Large proline-rich protein BAT3 [Cajanus cajan]
MGINGAEKIPNINNAESSETTIEIKIKTLDSQTYTLRVDKQMPVPALKEQIASVTGVLSERQRLICQGKVLKDDQLLSAYRILSLYFYFVFRKDSQRKPMWHFHGNRLTEMPSCPLSS